MILFQQIFYKFINYQILEKKYIYLEKEFLERHFSIY